MKKALSFTLVFLVLLFSCVGCSLKTKTKIKGDEVSQATQPVPTNPISDYDYKNLEASDELEETPKNSYYVSIMDDRRRLTFQDIYDEIKKCSPSITITRAISEDDIQKIMNIILFDTPEFFHLSYNYSYILDANQNVSKLYPKYLMKKSEYAVFFEKMDSWAASVSKTVKEKDTSSDNKKTTQYDTELKIINGGTERSFEKIDKTTLSIQERQKERNNSFSQNDVYLLGEKYDYFSKKIDIAKTMLGIREDFYNSESFSKAFCYIARKAGLETSCVVGELTDDQIVTFGGKKEAFSPPSRSIVKIADGLNREISINDCFYYWNIIKLNNCWYHVDTYYQAVLSNYLNDDSITKNFMPFINMSDTFASASRLAFYSEDLLGQLPYCPSLVFQQPYRTGNYFPEYNTSQMTIATNELLMSTVSSQKKNINLQLANLDNYKLFIKLFPDLLDQYNSNNKHTIRTYKILENPASYSIFLTGIEYN